jgi:hypothetical protein
VINLKKLILELKGRAQNYIPVSNDNIDLRLADYINASENPNKLTTLFIRERDGVYQFGTKRVFVKMENGKIFSKFEVNSCSQSWWRFLALGRVPEDPHSDRIGEDGQKQPCQCFEQSHGCGEGHRWKKRW